MPWAGFIKPLYVMIPTIEENPKGLYQRYIVSKTSGKPVDENAEYFVLRLDKNGKDPKHVKACRKAVLKYAEEIADHLPELSKDLIERYG
jgi:hypothetical protein